MVEVGPIGETPFHDAAQQGRQGLPIARLIDDHDRLAVQAQCPPGQDLEELLERPEAARQDYEGVRPLEHLQFSLMHGLDDDGLGQGGVARLALQQELGDDPYDRRPAGKGGICDQSHQSDTAAAIDESYTLASEQRAQPDGGVARGGVDAEAGAAEDAEGNGTGLGHEGFFLQAIRCLSGSGWHGIISLGEVATPRAVGRRTVGRVMSRTVFWLVGGGAIVIAVALAVAWRGKLTEQAVIEQATKPAVVAPPAAAPARQASPPPHVSSAPRVPPAPQVSPAPLASPAPSEAATKPSFDIARIGPDGRSVVAGRAAPGAKVVLLDGGKEIASSVADARGEWVIIAQEPPLGPGQHELRVIQHIEGRAPVTSEQVVIAVVPQPPSAAAPAPRDETLVMIVPPAGAATLVQPPSAAGVPKSGDLVISTVDYDDRGNATISGQAAPGTTVRGYIDDRIAAEGIAGADGRWRLAPANPIDQGKHTLRVDRLAKDGKPVARLELPFERVAVPPPTGSDTKRLYVVRGDNLWNIARAHYGVGWHHTKIFNANKDQIRDPDLIYPGQVFSLPKVD